MKLIVKIFLSLFVLVTISFGIYSAIIIGIEHRNTEKELNEKIGYNEQVYSSPVSYLLFQYDKEVLESLLTSIYKDKEIVKIELIDDSSFSNFTFDKKFDASDDLVESKIDLTHNNHALGTLTILYTKKYIDQYLQDYKTNIFYFSLFLSILFLFNIYFFIRKFTNSLSLLTDASDLIAQGDLSKQIKIKATDEIGDLANKFEYMRVTLKDRIEANEKQALEIFGLNKNLEQKVEQRTHELTETIESLKQAQNELIESEKMASLGGLVAGVAHEINTPVGICLMGITHFIDESSAIKKVYANGDLTEERFKTFLAETDENAQLIMNNLERTAHLVRSFKQVAVDQTSNIKREFNISKYIHEILFSLSNITKKTKIDINIDCSDKLTVKSYPGPFSQIITNLIINSIRHGFAEGEKGNINISISQQTDCILIEYTDDGKGINRENLDKVFDPFFTTNRKNGGTGLGLHLVYNIVTNLFKGDIKCISEENQGVEFTITLKVDFM